MLTPATLAVSTGQNTAASFLFIKQRQQIHHCLSTVRLVNSGLFWSQKEKTAKVISIILLPGCEAGMVQNL